mmetsp:Transcript_29874/g.26428  ORF Transcript_29874/g.26428 Transcript_29874/m.26428 type:complete len:267 (+) Transcript_29874:80-880(+)
MFRRGRGYHKKDDEESKENKGGRSRGGRGGRGGGGRGRGGRGRGGDKPRRGRLTHFIALPVEDSEIITNLSDFQSSLLEQYPDLLDKGWQMGPGKFHFTFFVISLADEEHVERATQTMNDLQPKLTEIIGETKFEIELNGVDGFTGKWNNSTRVLFAKVKQNENFDILKQITDTVIKGFIEDGVIKESDLDFQKLDPVTKMYNVNFHLTLFNTKYKRIKDKSSFDPTDILDNYQDNNFGTFNANKITMFKMKSRDGKYETETEIEF